MTLPGFIPDAEEKFGEQTFKSAIALIELHKTRIGEYPRSLEELEHLGDWDALWISAVRYEPTKNGYNLYLERGWMGKPELVLPDNYRNGLGIEETNIIWSAQD